MSEKERLVGQTRDTGFQIGVRRTLPIDHDQAWSLLMSRKGVEAWLGPIKQELAKGVAYRLADGIAGEVTVFAPNSHLRMTWQPPGWHRPSIIQVRVLPSSSGTTISFHQEWLPGPAEREERREWFTHAQQKLEMLAKLPEA